MLNVNCMRLYTSFGEVFPKLPYYLITRSRFIISRKNEKPLEVIKPGDVVMLEKKKDKKLTVTKSSKDSEPMTFQSKIPIKCHGCGITLQKSDPNRPGYYIMPAKFIEPKTAEEERIDDERELNRMKQEFVDFEYTNLDIIDDKDVEEEIKGRKMIKDWAKKANKKDFYLFKEELPKPPLKSKANKEAYENIPIICERCFNLKHYGKIKNEISENKNPIFDVDMLLQQRIQTRKGKKVVVLCIADLFDFDASIPKLAMRSLYPRGPHAHNMELIFIANKRDLIPKTIKDAKLEIWIRTQLNRYGLRSPKHVHIISCRSNFGIKYILKTITMEMMRSCDCYVIGVQNSGKSSFLNALKKLAETHKDYDLTEAILPGTTLGVVEVPGLPIPKNCKIYDTPGIEQVNQIAKHLTFQELKMVQPMRSLKPRTYRFGEGYTLLLAGLVRIDLIKCPSESLYVTVWISDELTCHLSKTNNINEKITAMRGLALRPPITNDIRLKSMQELISGNIKVQGNTWKCSTNDITIAGFGWIAIGCNGEAEFKIWSLNGVEIGTRPALLREYAREFQKPGFSTNVKSRGISK